MSVRLRNLVRGYRGPMHPLEKYVLSALADYCPNDEGINIFPGKQRLAEDTGLSIREIFYLIGRLKTSRFIDVEQEGGGRGHKTSYCIDLSRLVNPPERRPIVKLRNRSQNNKKPSTQEEPSAPDGSLDEDDQGEAPGYSPSVSVTYLSQVIERAEKELAEQEDLLGKYKRRYEESVRQGRPNSTWHRQAEEVVPGKIQTLKEKIADSKAQRKSLLASDRKESS